MPIFDPDKPGKSMIIIIAWELVVLSIVVLILSAF